MVCKHEQFEAAAVFNRLIHHDGGPVTAIHADITAHCAGCGQPVVFVCPDAGVATDRPTSSVDGQELRVPCFVAPAGPTP